MLSSATTATCGRTDGAQTSAFAKSTRPRLDGFEPIAEASQDMTGWSKACLLVGKSESERGEDMGRGDKVRYVPARHNHSRWATVFEVREDHLLVVRGGKFESVALRAVREVKEATV